MSNTSTILSRFSGVKGLFYTGHRFAEGNKPSAEEIKHERKLIRFLDPSCHVAARNIATD